MRKTAFLAALMAIGAAGTAEAAKPNLKATKVSAPPKTVAELSKFKVTDTVRNAGRKKAGASDVRYYLTTDPKRSQRERRESRTNPRTAISDILLEGSRPVPALGRREASSTKPSKPVEVRVPLGTRAGEYFLLACADDRGAVAENKEADNCTASAKVAVSALPLGPTTTFNDWLADAPDAEEAENLVSGKPLACTPTPGGPALNLKQALANIDAYLKARSPQGVKQFAASPAYRNASRAEVAAAEALLRELPGAALAATTRAHRLEPKEASHLVNAATVATSVGLPREALAMLDASLRLDDKVPGAWGFNRQAVQLTNRAQALAALGRFAEAGRTAEAAEAMEPSLTEAAATSSTAALCENNVPKAVQKLKKSRRRTWPPFPIDESLGKPQGLRKLQLPGFPGQAESFDTYYELQSNRLRADQTARIQRANKHEENLRAKQEDRLTVRQGNRLMTALYASDETPQLQAQYAEINRLINDVQDYRIRFFCRDSDCEPEAHYYTQFFEEASAVCEGDPRRNCFEIEMNNRCRPALKSYHQGWLTRMETLWAKTDAYHRASSKRMSAMAANIADPDRHALAMIQIAQAEEARYALLMQQAAFWAHDIQIRSDHCVEAPEDPVITPEDAAAAAGDPCTSRVKPFNVVLPLGPAAIKLSCEKVQFTANGEGWIRAFSEISYDYRAGRLTVFAGSQAEIGAGVKVDFKSGLYLTVDNQGFHDAGWRVGPGYTVGAGPLEYNPDDLIDISFVGIFSAEK